MLCLPDPQQLAGAVFTQKSTACFGHQTDGKADVFCLELLSHLVFMPYFLAAYTHVNLLKSLLYPLGRQRFTRTQFYYSSDNRDGSSVTDC